MSEEGRTLEKAWGFVTCVAHRMGIVKVDVLQCNAAHRSSWHHHPHWVNLFYAVSGRFRIVLEGGAEHVLSAADSLRVPAGTWHEFQCVESGVLVEVYWCEDPGEDIVRDTARLGGRMEP
jgi:mannose-6-phosphate isomerase-like protein (cupin superfamily)